MAPTSTPVAALEQAQHATPLCTLSTGALAQARWRRRCSELEGGQRAINMQRVADRLGTLGEDSVVAQVELRTQDNQKQPESGQRKTVRRL